MFKYNWRVFAIKKNEKKYTTLKFNLLFKYFH